MNNVRLLFLLYAYCANVTWAFLFRRVPETPSLYQHLSSKTHHAESPPLLLTPLINAGILEEARNRSRVSPLKDVESYAGFLTVNETTKSHLYFWFIPKTTTNYTSSPIILWLQGGPGCSSLFGLFTENGPFEVTEKGDIKRRKFAWTNNYHMLYIDQPVGAGFSFTEENKYINSQEEIAEHLYTALVQFFKLFTEFNDHDFYVAGESYGGKYVPSIGHKIHTANQQSNLHHIRLKGMMIGNGYSDPENMLEYAEFLHVTGSIDGNERQQLEVIQERIRNHLESGHWLQASNQFHYLMANVDNFTKLNIYDYTSKNSSADSMDVSYTQVFTDVIRQHIHVGNISYKLVSYEVYHALELDFMQSARSKIEELLDHYPMLFYNGQFDIICAHWLTENYLDKLHWSGATKYSLAKKQIWRVGENVAGYYKSAANLVYVMVRNAGHMVPSDQPENALNLVDMFIGKKLQDNSTHN